MDIISMALSPDGDKILTGLAGGFIKEWDINSGKCIKVYKGHKSKVNSLQYSPDGKKFISGSNDKTIKEWDISGKIIKTYKRYGYVYSLCYSPDGEYFISGEDGGEVTEFHGRKAVKRYAGDYTCIRCVLYCNGVKMIISGGEALWDSYEEDYKKNELVFWDRDTGEAIKRYGIKPSLVSSMALSPDNKKVVLGSFENDIYEIDLDDGNISVYKGHKDGITSLSFSIDGRNLISASRDKTVKEWDVKTKKCIKTYEEYSNRVNAVIYGGEKIISSDNNNFKVLT